MDEDGADASFAGQHLTLLNVPSIDDLSSAIRQIWWSANSDSVITYRKRVGLFNRPSVGVVVQSLLAPETAGVMFTQNPVNGADERMIEASWGLGEVGGLRSGDPRHLPPGPVGGGARADGRSEEDRHPLGGRRRHGRRGGGHPISSSRSASMTINSPQLNALAGRCEEVYGRACDIEWAYRRREPLSPAVPGGDPGRIDDAADRPDPGRAHPKCSSRCRSSPG